MKQENEKPSILRRAASLIEEKPQEPAPEEPAEDGAPAEAPQKAPAAPAPEAKPQNRNKALILYISLLFSASFLFVLVSFIQHRDSTLTISQLNENASSAVSLAEQLQDANRTLTDENRTLMEKNTELDDMNEDLQERLVALQEELEAAHQEAAQKDEAIAAAEAAVQEEKDNTAKAQQAYELLIAAENALDQDLTPDFEEAMTQLKDLTDYLSEFGLTRYEELAAHIQTPEEVQ